MNIKELVSSGRKHDFLFFWGHNETYGMTTKACLSQWYDSAFEVDGVLYSSAEQYMMAEKARLMGDEDVRAKILSTDDPRAVKKLGRAVKNFDSNLWDKHKSDVVIRGNYAKFTQNDRLRDFLLSTGDKVLVEASPFDNIWGIGLEAHTPEAQDPTKWKGQNLLGFALMRVRDIIRGEKG